jgi:hypothetical protein
MCMNVYTFIRRYADTNTYISSINMQDNPLQRSDSILVVDGGGIKIMTQKKHEKRQKNVTNVLCLLGISSLDADELESGIDLIYICIHIYIYTYIYVYKYVYIYIYIYMFI